MNINVLKTHIPDSVLLQITDVINLFEINTPLRLSHFLSQCAHESGDFKHTSENLNYSAEGLKKIFPKYFPGNLSDLYARQPEKIASRVYANRMGNGDEASKDGYKFRGRGYIQLTGKSNYGEFDKFVKEDILTTPDLVATQYPLLSAAWFFSKNNINTISDTGSSEQTITAVTKKINGGIIGLQDRITHFNTFYNLLK